MNKLLPLLLLLLLFAFGCQDDEDIITTPEALTYLALGDSYTIGESVSESQRFPVLLAQDLRAEGIDIADPTIIARTGWTTANLQNGIAAADFNGQNFALVSLLIGVNNQFQGRSLAEYEEQFAQLLQQAIDFAGGNKDRVFVVSVPDYAFTPFGENFNQEQISAEIDQFNDAAAAITAARQIDYYNITPISRTGLDDRDLVADDGLHPSGEQYQLWVDSFITEIIEKLQ